jgi:methylenetetrahydrofolate--tRNA-(uracil-5-)-methyltransferase
MLRGEEPIIPPPTTMLGALYRYLREADPKHFQPMNANFGLVEELPGRWKDKRLKREKIAERALHEMREFAGAAVMARA